MATLGELGHGGAPSHLPRVAYFEPAAVNIPPFRPGEVVTLDLRRALSILRRRMGLFVVVALVVMAAVATITLLTPPQYRATAQVMLNRRNVNVTNINDVLSAGPPDSTAVDTEVEILRSPLLAQHVVRSLKLDRDREFNPRVTAAAAPLSRKQFEAVVAGVRKNLSISRSGLTYVIDVGFKSRNPAKAATIANEFARLYLAQQIENKVQATQQAAGWLNGQLQQLRGQLTADETAVQQFKIANNLMSAEGATLAEREISTYNQSLAQATAQVAEDDARLNTARRQLARGSTGDDVGEALNSPTIQKLKEQRADASRKLASLRTNFQDAYPDVKKARNELADIDAQITAETGRVISNLDARAQVSQRRAAAVASSVGGAKGHLAENSRASVHLSELERNAQASRALYESYLARYKETSSKVGLAEADARLVSEAADPSKLSSPNVPLNLVLGAALAAAAGLGAVGLAQMLESGLATSADIEKRFNLRYLGAIPALASAAKRGKKRAKLAPTDFIVERPFSSFSEAFRSLVASIVHGTGSDVVKTVAVTSALPGEGKTTTAICLGRAAALQGYRVVIVDCDLRRRSLQRIVGKPVGVGLLEVIAGQAELDQAIVRDTPTTADILPLGDAPTSLKDVFGSAAMDRLLLDLKSRYDLVVLDTAPVVPVADARVLAQKADFVVMVARWRTTPYQAIQGALRLLSGNNVRIGGMVLNQVDMEQQVRHGYGDVAHYFNAYRKYYLE
ncbi:MAG: lipopolysaccharide biosynthesis protein [Caulobacteraceae bacterium]|nr:lipopolysaccharide biosynthesis protein [Caulobacteraceae bacterium]